MKIPQVLLSSMSTVNNPFNNAIKMYKCYVHEQKEDKI